MDPRLTKAQRDLDALLPEFLTIADPDKLKGTCWITVTDLALTRTTRYEDRADKSVLFVEGTWPSPEARIRRGGPPDRQSSLHRYGGDRGGG